MDLLFRESGGRNLVFAAGVLPRYYPPATAQAVAALVLWKYPEESPSSSRVVGVFPLGVEGGFHYSPDVDRDVQLAAITIAADGTYSVSDPADAEWVTLSFVRETDAPLIGLTGNVTADTAEIGITGFTRFARYRRLRVWADSAMTTKLREVPLDSDDYASRELPRYFVLKRDAAALTLEAGNAPPGDALTREDGAVLGAESESSSLPQTVYVTVAHSGGTGWTPESNVLAITFASGDGTTPGSAGDFDPTPRDSARFETL